jgi:hypothetical protein
MRGLFRAGKTYDFLLHANGTIATAAITGTFTGNSANWSPAVTSFSEWTALAALFDEVVLRSSHFAVTSAFGPTSTSIIIQVVIAPDIDTVNPSTFTPIQRIAESEVFHCYNMSTTPGRFTKVHRIRGRPYATTAIPAGASGTPSGCLGQWVFAQNIAGTPSINYFFYTMENVVRLRNRA